VAKTVLLIEGMTCHHCAERVESALRAVPGVFKVQIDWKSGRGLVEHAETVDPDGLTRVIALSAEGTAHQYKAEPVSGDKQAKGRGISGALFFPALLLPALCCGGVVILLPALAALSGFLASKWIGVALGLVLAVVLGPGTWWVLRRRRKVCATCLEAGSERARP